MKKVISNDDILKAIDKIPMLPTSLYRLLKISSQPDHSIADIINIVKTDSSLTAKILKIANSAAFAPVSPIISIDRAISFIGEGLVVSIALNDSMQPLFKKDLEGYMAKRGDLWKHDLRVAIASKELCKFTNIKVCNDFAFTAGILHDIGKVIITDFLKNNNEDIVSYLSLANRPDYLNAEFDILGTNHTKVGFELAKKWNLPELLQIVILNHHEPGNVQEEYKTITYIVHLADSLAMMAGYGTGIDTLQYKLDSNYINYINLSPDDIDRIFIEVDEEFNKLVNVIEK